MVDAVSDFVGQKSADWPAFFAEKQNGMFSSKSIVELAFVAAQRMRLANGEATVTGVLRRLEKYSGLPCPTTNPNLYYRSRLLMLNGEPYCTIGSLKLLTGKRYTAIRIRLANLGIKPKKAFNGPYVVTLAEAKELVLTYPHCNNLIPFWNKV